MCVLLLVLGWVLLLVLIVLRLLLLRVLVLVLAVVMYMVAVFLSICQISNGRDQNRINVRLALR